MKPRIHTHRWRLLLHSDGCHWWLSTYICECGCVRRDQGEREDDGSGYFGAIWQREGCSRCAEIAAGYPPHPMRSDIDRATAL